MAFAYPASFPPISITDFYSRNQHSPTSPRINCRAEHPNQSWLKRLRDGSGLGSTKQSLIFRTILLIQTVMR